MYLQSIASHLHINHDGICASLEVRPPDVRSTTKTCQLRPILLVTLSLFGGIPFGDNVATHSYSTVRRHLLGRLKVLCLRNRLVRGMRRNFRPFHPLHQLRMTHPRNAFFFRHAVQLRMKIVAAFAVGFLHLHRNAMCVGPSILANAGNLPGDFHPRLPPPRS